MGIPEKDNKSRRYRLLPPGNFWCEHAAVVWGGRESFHEAPGGDRKSKSISPLLLTSSVRESVDRCANGSMCGVSELKALVFLTPILPFYLDQTIRRPNYLCLARDLLTRSLYPRTLFWRHRSGNCNCTGRCYRLSPCKIPPFIRRVWQCRTDHSRIQSL